MTTVQPTPLDADDFGVEISLARLRSLFQPHHPTGVEKGSWTSWQRWTALAILTHAFLSVMAATEPRRRTSRP